ncbi:aspartate kinase [Cesiribacter andamanensis]|uniref:Aspartokinase n=1 Tax=Cesiribacter andamanensis AMV16 TaxID=1279009 RepID=M7NYZ2_9BACT|nr:aspartate kinase [Cesiribacter andamanensis]EMR03589.1 Lysine-sensitive aspartokinase 3 [Cesiribacter andamanensis AMV16]
MKVFKFGGASVKDAEGVKNVVRIIQSHSDEPLLVVVSAMGKTTNALEVLLQLSVEHQSYAEKINELYEYHLQIVKGLFEDIHHEVHFFLAQRFQSLTRALQKARRQEYNQVYDEVVAHGELISSGIVQAYLAQQGAASRWVDARSYISTNNLHREAQINWPLTSSRINRDLAPILEGEIVITQGFIGKSSDGHTTTLGREGSDFSAAIFAASLNAASVTIWKDVPGVLNADPKRLASTVLYPELSYYDAAEMTYFGASVIHPKTIKPLANQQIPLLVRSFKHPDEPGTRIHQSQVVPPAPAIIFKQDQTLITFNIRDFSFITERNMSSIFYLLDLMHIKINVMQNSAISVSICIDGNTSKNEALINSLSSEYDIRFNTGLSLLTIKNYTEETIAEMSRDKEILLEQRTRHTYQIVVRS